MKRILILVLFSGLLLDSLSLNSKVINIKAKIGTEQNTENIDHRKIDSDSVRIVGNMILNGGRIWGKNEDYLFSIMDSLTCKNKDSRLFYFKVFGEICKQADGYVGEVIGDYTLRYFEFDPQEFIENSKIIPDSIFESMGNQAGVEILMSSNKGYKMVIQKLITTTRNKTKNMNISDKNKLELFFKQMKEGQRLELRVNNGSHH